MEGPSSSPLGKIYLWAVPTAGLLTLIWAATDVAAYPPSPYWVALTLLTGFTGSFTVKIPGMVARLSVSEPFVFASALLFGPAAGTVTVAVDAGVMSLRLMPSLRTPHRVLFNVGTLVLSVAASSLAFFWLTGTDSRKPEYPAVSGFIWPLYVFSACCFVINSSLVALALSVERGASAWAIWRQQFLWLSVNYFAGASVAALIVVFARTIDLAILGIIVPLVAISYLTFRTTLGRLDDANRHLGDLNALYLSTIETLAMAIDAKDQVTHGHIRRVQRYATGLARALGMTNDRHVRAIEAAALLHDMGKLAIPEFILKKPGKLTAREFSLMKTHATVGAELLSSIRFPYPVVPIVRHHHENWDGSGYPDGLKGAEIPIGARILAVVDCYDALTSHRPYRPAMGVEEALSILAQRRGKMYDPLVVDAFVREHAALSADAHQEVLPAALLANQADGISDEPAMMPLDAPVESLKVLAALAPYPTGAPAKLVCRQIVASLRSVAPFDTAAVFVLNDASSVAELLHIEGSFADQLRGLEIPVGERLSGWVAAHQTAVWNSDATLDLVLSGLTTPLVLASSLPLCAGDSTGGVLTLYGRPGQTVSVSQRHALELLMPTLAMALDAARSRPAVAIDCGLGEVREAALAALDSLLSHGTQTESHGPAAVISITIASLVGDRSTLERAAATLAQRLSPQLEAQRCVVVVSAAHLLLCALDGASYQELKEEVEVASCAEPLQSCAVSITIIRSSLELQDRMRRVEGAVSSSASTISPSRVH